MEKSASFNRSSPVDEAALVEPRSGATDGTDPLAVVAWHGLAWLSVSNCIGLLLGWLLLFPQMNGYLGEWTYGRWMPLHLNLNLYGWGSLPLVAWLLKVYHADRPPAAEWSRAALWGWSAALAVGAVSWLTGHGSGKLFLDWDGYARAVWAVATFFLWLVLAWSLRCHWLAERHSASTRRVIKVAGLAALLFVPVILYWAAEPSVYPPVNPDTGGPTGASLLESTLGIVLILLLLPHGVVKREPARWRTSLWVWILLAAEAALSVAMGRGNSSHHLSREILGLGSLIIWVAVLPVYFNSFQWPPGARRWLTACLCWWGILVVSSWVMFLPGILDHCKFTDALVGHSHMAMAGFLSSLNVFLLVCLLGQSGRGFCSTWAFYAWQAGTLGYVLTMFAAGWFESGDLGFTIVPGRICNLLYALRLLSGAVMTAAGIHWWVELSRSPGGKASPETGSRARPLSRAGRQPTETQ